MKPPIVDHTPLIGNIREIGTKPEEWLMDMYQTHGSMFQIMMLNTPVTIMIGPEYQEFFFTQTDKLLNVDQAYDFLKTMFGEVALTAPNATYLEQRPVLHSPFRREKMAIYIEIMQQQIQRWLDSLEDWGVTDISGEIDILVQEVAGHALMGAEFHNQLGREWWDLFVGLTRSMNPVIPQKWPLPNNIQREYAKYRMRNILNPVIAERRANPEQYDDFLQDILTTHMKSGGLIEDSIVGDIVRGLMFAGHETTASQGAWLLIEILRTPDYLAKIQQELTEHMPRSGTIDATTMRNLEHCMWAVREGERMHPAASILMRVVEHPFELGGYHFSAGDRIMIVPPVAHRMPELWSKPDIFDPLRFAPGREEDKQHRYSMIGFGGGMHKCTGMNFANNEMLLIVALLFQQFDVELLTAEPKNTYGTGTARPTGTYIYYRRKANYRTNPESKQGRDMHVMTPA